MKQFSFAMLGIGFVLFLSTAQSAVSETYELSEYACELREQANTTATSSKKHTLKTKQTLTPAGWHVQIALSIKTPQSKGYKEVSKIVLGELEYSKNKKDKQDHPSQEDGAIEMFFINLGGESDLGKYCSNYHAYVNADAKKRAVWLFKIQNSSAKYNTLSMKIDIDGVYNILSMERKGKRFYVEAGINSKKMDAFTLVDVDKGIAYLPYEFSDLNISMNGMKTRTFKLVKGLPAPQDYEKYVREEGTEVLSKKKMQMKKPKRKKEAVPEFVEDPPVIDGHFGLPPSF